MNLYYLFVFTLVLGGASADSENSHGKCEPITISMCKDLFYNKTKMPNNLHHDTQEEAGLEIHQFWPLVEIKCSPDLKLFLCTIYAPSCTGLPPCRSLCESAKMVCEGLMIQYGFSWPELMKCSNFPESDKDGSCIDGKTNEIRTTKAPEDVETSTQHYRKRSTQRLYPSQHSEDITTTATPTPLCTSTPSPTD